MKAIVLAAGLAVAMSTPTSRKSPLETLVDTFENKNQFSSTLFLNVMEEMNQNVLVSPLSVILVLAMAYYGAAGSTATQMRTVLNLPSDDLEGLTAINQIIEQLQILRTDVELLNSHKMFVDEEFQVEDAYKRILGTYFHSISEKVPFANTERAAEMINDYFEQQTKGLVKDVISTEDLDSSTVMMLVNALYFKGNWSEHFDPNRTVSKPFHIGKDEMKNVPTMYKQSELYHGEVPGFGKFVQLEYKQTDMSMVILVPDSGHELEELVSQITGKNMDEILSKKTNKLVSLSLPKFKFDSKMNLNEVLKKFGMTEMFGPGANFSKMSKTPLHIGNVVQKAAIEVNEFGTEAAAANGVGVSNSFVETVEFKVNRPFFFSILSKSVTLFMGIVRDPTA